MKRDLVAAGISFEDNEGRRVDLHALRKTFGTMLAVADTPLRVTMDLMRHSSSKLTERVYTDEAHLPTISALAALPSFRIPKQDAPHDAPSDAPTGAATGLLMTVKVVSGRGEEIAQISVDDALGHEKAPGVVTGRLSKMEQAKRLELSNRYWPFRNHK